VGLVLVVEDEMQIANTLEAYLRRDNFKTERAADGRRALALFRASRPDVVLLDIMLPELDGLEVLQAIRREAATPVIMLTARVEEVDKLLGLGLGADDYVTKPFSFREVVARVKVALRRSQGDFPSEEAVLRVGPLTIDPDKVRAEVASRPLALTATEFRLLVCLAQAPGRVFSRGELLEAALPESDTLERTVDSHLKNLRRKLADAGAAGLLQTVRGMGYRLGA
jgi:two-component system response regulator AdeR